MAGAGIPEIPPVDFAKFGEIEEVPLSRIKKISGPHLHRTWLNVPQVTQHDEADITELEAFRKELDGAAKEQGYRVTLLAFLIKAAVSALRKFPDVNASLAPDKENLILKKYVHMGVAVDTPGGLVVPVVRDVDRKGVDQLSRELGRALQEGARGQARLGRAAGRLVHHLEPRRHRRHRLHAAGQRARGRDPRRGPRADGAGLGRRASSRRA